MYKRQLQEYNLDWEYVPGKKNIVADKLSRVNIEGLTFSVDQENVGRVYHILKSREELEVIFNRLKEDQTTDPKLKANRERIEQNDATILPFYCVQDNVIFTRPTSRDHVWKLYVPKAAESLIIWDYHVRYGHMGPIKVVKALEEHLYLKGINKKVRQTIKSLQTLPISKGQ